MKIKEEIKMKEKKRVVSAKPEVCWPYTTPRNGKGRQRQTRSLLAIHAAYKWKCR
jgi:hypothetical protein